MTKQRRRFRVSQKPSTIVIPSGYSIVTNGLEDKIISDAVETEVIEVEEAVDVDAIMVYEGEIVETEVFQPKRKKKVDFNE